jgi:hypothetical protein
MIIRYGNIAGTEVAVIVDRLIVRTSPVLNFDSNFDSNFQQFVTSIQLIVQGNRYIVCINLTMSAEWGNFETPLYKPSANNIA